jgi:hypothetical protein
MTEEHAESLFRLRKKPLVNKIPKYPSLSLQHNLNPFSFATSNTIESNLHGLQNNRDLGIIVIFTGGINTRNHTIFA